MSRYLFLVLAVPWAVALVPASAAGGESAAVVVRASAEPLATVERFSSALSAGDRGAVLDCLAADVVIFEHGGAELSREEYANHHLAGDLAYLRAIKVRVVERRVLDGGDRVVVLTRTESSGEFRGKPVRSRGTETLVLERRDQRWAIVHVHWSSGKQG